MSGTFWWPVRVYYEDTDVGGVVYYANYLRFMERARTEWLRDAGFEQDELMDSEGILFAVAAADVRYRRPARFNNRLFVSAEPAEIRQSSMVVDQRVCLDEAGGPLLTTGRIRIACLGTESFRPRPIPEHILSEIRP